MMDVTEGATARLRWGRALLAAFLAEMALALIAAPIFATLGTVNSEPVLDWTIPPASFVVFVGAGWWAARPEPRAGTLTGLLTGVWAVALYVALGFVASRFVPGTSVTDGFTGPYLAAHVLKVLGGALGGWLVARKARARIAGELE